MDMLGVNPCEGADRESDVAAVSVGGNGLGSLGFGNGGAGALVEGLDVGDEIVGVGWAEGRGVGGNGGGGCGMEPIIEEEG